SWSEKPSKAIPPCGPIRILMRPDARPSLSLSTARRISSARWLMVWRGFKRVSQTIGSLRPNRTAGTLRLLRFGRNHRLERRYLFVGLGGKVDGAPFCRRSGDLARLAEIKECGAECGALTSDGIENLLIDRFGGVSTVLRDLVRLDADLGGHFIHAPLSFGL